MDQKSPADLKATLRQYRRVLLIMTFLVSLVVLFIPLAGSETSIGNWDKIIHVGLFLFLGFFAVINFPWRSGRVALGLIIYAIASELIQQHILGRGYQTGDLIADGIGVVLGLLASQNYFQK